MCRHLQKTTTRLAITMHSLFQSMLSFLKDPTGDAPWEEDTNATSVVHVNSEQVLVCSCLSAYLSFAYRGCPCTYCTHICYQMIWVKLDFDNVCLKSFQLHPNPVFVACIFIAHPTDQKNIFLTANYNNLWIVCSFL